MRPLHLFIIAMIVGTVIGLAAPFALTGPAPVSAPGTGISGGDTKYAVDSALPPPRYYSGIDFDTLKTNDHLTVLPLKSYRQQMTNYSCGAVAAMTVMSYYGMPLNNTDADEDRIAHEMNRDVTEKTGINPQQVVSWLQQQGMNASWSTGGTRDTLRRNLKSGVPTMVEWMDWGGHWVVVTGYDTRGTDTVWDDVIIFADSVDTHDDRVDGVTYFNYGEFDAMWFDAHYFPENMQNRVYVVAVPGTLPQPE